MSSSDPNPRQRVRVMDYAPPQANLPAMEALAGVFGQGVAVAVTVWSLAVIFLAGEPPDPPLAGLCLVFGSVIVAVTVGVLSFFAAMLVRRWALGTRTRFRSKAVAFSSGVGYVLQILVLGWAIAWVRQAGSNSWVYGLIPVVPLLAPFWVIVREQ